MWQTAVIVFGLASGYALFEAIVAFRAYQTKRGWYFSAAAIPLVLVTGFATWQWLRDPLSPGSNYGFGPEWDCIGEAKPGAVCVKRPPNRPAETGAHPAQ
jgi:hypothetical protein